MADDLTATLTALFTDAIGAHSFVDDEEAVAAGVPRKFAASVHNRSLRLVNASDIPEAAADLAALIEEHRREYSGTDPAKLAKHVERY